MKTAKKVIGIALDAVESTLMEMWMDQGYLPNLASLREKGSYGSLSSSAEWLAGSTWPTFYTGTLPGDHGFYHYLQWRSDQMRFQRPGPEWIRAQPFWRRLGGDLRAIAVDIPLTFPPTPFNGIEIAGWASHDRIYPTASFPRDKLSWVIKNFGKPPIETEVGGLLEIDDVLAIKETLLLANQKECALVTSLIKSEAWNLFLCCFSSPHRAGHKFWATTNVKGEISESRERRFKTALREIYQSCDQALGKILDCLDDDTVILVFSLHGMGTNTTLADTMLAQMMARILDSGRERQGSGKTGMMTRLRNMIPLEIRAGIRKNLPFWLQDKMTAHWRHGGTDWKTTRAFNLIADLQGYIRVNLAGREINGIVPAGEAYDRLCDHIIQGLESYKDAQTMEPVVEETARSDQLFHKGPGFDNLPDILVKWRNAPVAQYAKIVSEAYGELDFPLAGSNPDGRSGNHRPNGFLLAVGEPFSPNAAFGKSHHVVDLAPTILSMLQVERPPEMVGEIIGKP